MKYVIYKNCLAVVYYIIMSNKYIKQKKLKAIERTQERAKKLSSIIYTCPYCSKETNLLIFTGQHMKSKKCLMMKKLYFESEALKTEPKTEFYLLNQINEAIQAQLHPPADKEPLEEILYKKAEPTAHQKYYNLINHS